MPLGIAAVKWDDRLGTKLIAKYPPDLEIEPVLTMRVYGSHVLGERRESNFITMKVDELNIASYYGGIDINKFVMMLLDSDERGEDYQEALTLLGGELLAVENEGQIAKRLPEVYAKITSFLQYSLPQRIALALLDEDRYEILQHLLEVGHTKVSEARKFSKKPIDFILDPLIDLQIISRKWVQGVNDEIVFLLRYVWIGRAPPSFIPQDLSLDVKTFFDKYTLNDDEIRLILETMVDQAAYSVISDLDSAQPKTLEEITSSVNFSEDEILDALDRLEDSQFVTMKNDRYYLISRPVIVLTVAKNVIRQVLRELNEGAIERNVALHILTDIRNELAKELGVL